MNKICSDKIKNQSTNLMGTENLIELLFLQQTIQFEILCGDGLINKMNQASKDVMNILISSERLADKVLQNKQELLELDKRRQNTREAARLIDDEKDKKVPKAEKKLEKNVWVMLGPVLVKMDRKKALILLKKGN